MKKQYYPLTSVDMDPEICRIFQLRQRMEGHSNPSRVVCEDFLAYKQPNAFDLLTIIGSTLNQMGKTQQALTKAHETAFAIQWSNRNIYKPTVGIL